MNKQRLGLLIAGAVTIVGTVLPWINFMGIGVMGLQAGWPGLVTVAFAVVMIVMAVLGDRSAGLSGASKIVPLVCGALTAALTIFVYIGWSPLAGMGLLVSAAGGILGVVLPLVMKGGDNA